MEEESPNLIPRDIKPEEDNNEVNIYEFLRVDIQEPTHETFKFVKVKETKEVSGSGSIVNEKISNGEYSGQVSTQWNGSWENESQLEGNGILNRQIFEENILGSGEGLNSVEITNQDASETNENVQWYYCKCCEFRTKNRHSLTHHTKIKHTDKLNLFCCGHCGIKMKFKQSLQRHIIIKHIDTAEWHQCNHCEYKTKGEQSLRLHIRFKHNDSDIKWHHCQLCDYQTKHKSHLSRHCKRKHDEWYQCTSCSYRTNVRVHLAQHVKSEHTAGQRFQCLYCDYEARHKSHLIRHFEIKHDETTEWNQCTLCEFRTKDRTYLKHHMKRRHGTIDPYEKPNTIASLSQFFRRVYNQNGDLWYHCILCDHRTPKTTEFKRHFTQKHDDSAKWHKCQLCRYKSKLKYDLKVHIRKKHPDYPQEIESGDNDRQNITF